MRKILFVLILCFFILSENAAFAASSYVLPYPSTMPGSIFYKIHLAEEAVLRLWYFGNYGQFFYNLKESDRYLVEAKTLFEYNQYLLGFNALEKSNVYLKNCEPFLIRAQKEGKNISQNKLILSHASQKHIEVLTDLVNRAPQTVNWTPEKSSPTKLELKKLIEESIVIRNKAL
jgi:hypothetical protein